MSAPPSLWTGQKRLVLASKSRAAGGCSKPPASPSTSRRPTSTSARWRRDFLAQGGGVETLALALARAKAIEVSARRPGAPCVGADQTLTLEGRLVHKSETLEVGRADARRAQRPQPPADLGLRAGARRARSCTRARTRRYDHAGARTRGKSPSISPAPDASVLASVGVYQIEGLGVHLFEAIEGDHATILGLPMLDCSACLRREGMLAL